MQVLDNKSSTAYAFDLIISIANTPLITWPRRLCHVTSALLQSTKLPLFRARKMPPPWLIRGSSAVLTQKFQRLQQLQFSIASQLCAKRWKEKSVPAYTSRFVLWFANIPIFWWALFRFSNPIREVAGMKAPLPEKTDMMWAGYEF